MASRRVRLTGREGALILGLLVILGLVSLPAMRYAGERSRRTSCQAQLRQWGQIYRLFASEHGGRYPGRFLDYQNRIRPENGFWAAADISELFPEYLNDLNLLLCPSIVNKPAEGWTDVQRGYGYPATTGYRRGIDPSWADSPVDTPAREAARAMRAAKITQIQADAWCRDTSPDNDQYCYWRPMEDSYSYWGWTVRGEQVSKPEDMAEMGRVVDNDADDRSPLNPGCNLKNYLKDFDVVLPIYGRTRIYYLREGVERFFITDIQDPGARAKTAAEIPVLFDKLEASLEMTASQPKDWVHRPAGPNVLFMDGHAEFMPYPQANGSVGWMASDAAMYDKSIYWP